MPRKGKAATLRPQCFVSHHGRSPGSLPLSEGLVLRCHHHTPPCSSARRECCPENVISYRSTSREQRAGLVPTELGGSVVIFLGGHPWDGPLPWTPVPYLISSDDCNCFTTHVCHHPELNILTFPITSFLITISINHSDNTASDVPDYCSPCFLLTSGIPPAFLCSSPFSS